MFFLFIEEVTYPAKGWDNEILNWLLVCHVVLNIEFTEDI